MIMGALIINNFHSHVSNTIISVAWISNQSKYEAVEALSMLEKNFSLQPDKIINNSHPAGAPETKLYFFWPYQMLSMLCMLFQQYLSPQMWGRQNKMKSLP